MERSEAQTRLAQEPAEAATAKVTEEGRMIQEAVEAAVQAAERLFAAQKAEEERLEAKRQAAEAERLAKETADQAAEAAAKKAKQDAALEEESRAAFSTCQAHQAQSSLCEASSLKGLPVFPESPAQHELERLV